MTASGYDAALAALYQASHEGFVAERKRLAAELKANGDKGGAAALAKLERPTISAWAVNQLYWQKREAFDELLDSAEQWRKGRSGAAALHRDAATKLRNLAAELLRGSGHAAAEATLRRVSASLSAIAAGGGFAPDPPGALRTDRDPPGFGALEGAIFPPAEAATPAGGERRSSKAEHDERGEGNARAAAERRRADEAEARRREQDSQRRKAAQKRLETELRNAKSMVETQTLEVERLDKRRREALADLERAQKKVEKLEAELETLNSE